MQFQYFEKLYANLKKVESKEKDNIEKAIKMFEETIANEKSIYIFGASHAGLVSQEVYYRSGGFVLFNPILPRELSLDNVPVSLTSKMERLEGYGSLLSSKANFSSGDLLILHSVSGRNPVAIDLAIEAKKKDVNIIVITSLEYTKSVNSRHSSGKRLYEMGDLVIDNHCPKGDAVCTLEGTDQKIASTSNVIAIAVLNAIVVEVAQKMLDSGVEHLPFFYSANVDGGADKNKQVFELYRNQIHYEL